VTLYHIYKYLNNWPVFAAIISKLVMMSVLDCWRTAYDKNGQLQTKHLLVYLESCSRRLFDERHTVN